MMNLYNGVNPLNENYKKKEKENNNETVNELHRIFKTTKYSNVSLFSNYYASESLMEIELKDWLFCPAFKKQVRAYRNSSDPVFRKQIKGNLPCITPSGIFSYRKNSQLRSHSGFICIDIDGKDNPDTDWEATKFWLGSYLPSLYYAGLSIGGDGIFSIFRIQIPDKHSEHFFALEKELMDEYEITVDKVCRNVSRLRVVSYDPNPYFNPGAIPYDKIISCTEGNIKRITTNDEAQRVRRQVEKIVKYVVDNGIDITDDYNDWYRIGFALASEFGLDGESYFRKISRISPKYDELDLHNQYEWCIKANKTITIRTFFYICKRHGINIKGFM